MKNRKKMTVNQMVLIALAACINTAGGQAALALRLPVYLDSVGTILAGMLLGPVYGMLPSLLSGILMGMTTDIYSLYFAPVGMITGFMAGLASRGTPELTGHMKKSGFFLASAMIAIPGAIFTESFLAYIGLGIRAPESSIGVLLSQGQKVMQQYPNQVFFPAVVISLLMIAFNMLSNGLRDAFDPTQRGA